MMSSSKAKEIIESQKQRILDLCKEAYPDGVLLQEIVMQTNFNLNKIPLEDLIREGSIEHDGEYIRLNG